MILFVIFGMGAIWFCGVAVGWCWRDREDDPPKRPRSRLDPEGWRKYL